MIRIYDEYKEVKMYFERALPFFGLKEDDNLILVNADFVKIQELEEIRNIENAVIIFYSFFTENYIREHKPEIAALLCKKHIGFIRMPVLLIDIKNLYDKLVLGEKQENKAAFLRFKIERKRNLIGLILHDITYQNKKEKCFALSKEEFGLEGTEEEIIEKLKNMREEANNYFIKKFSCDEVLNGVFCDIQGTFIDLEGFVRQEVLEMLKNYEEQGNPITLWTGGNIKDIKSFIPENITWPLLSKDDFIGCEVEVVIDDMLEEEFSQRYQIKFKEYIRV